MASSEAYEDSQFNLAAQGRRQPGSAFKPFVLTTAVDQGIDPDSTYYPAPSSITLDAGRYGEAWTVSGGGSGTMSLREATANSVNTVFAQLGHRRRPGELHRDGEADGDHDRARRLPGRGARRPHPGRLGARDVERLRDARQRRRPPRADRDPARSSSPTARSTSPRTRRATRVVSDGVAYTVADVMKGTLEYGTAAGHGIGCPGRRQDRDHRGAVRRLVRRLHAARLDRGLGRQPRRARAAARLRRRPRGADLARLHDDRGDRAVRRLPGAREPGRALGLLQRHTPSRLRLRLDRRPTLPDDPRDDDPGRRRRPTTPTPATAPTTPTSTRRAPARTRCRRRTRRGRRRATPAPRRRRRRPGRPAAAPAPEPAGSGFEPAVSARAVSSS